MELERLKTIVLTLLIIISLMLSGFLWNSTPELENLTPSDYVAPQPAGHKYEVTDVIRPSFLMFHTGEGKHRKAPIESAMYEKLMSRMNQWYFYNFVDTHLVKEEWEELINKRRSVEIVYNHEIPADIASELFTLRSHAEGNFRSISRILLYENEEKNAVDALLISNRNQQVIRVHTSVEPEEVENLFAPGNLAGLSEQILYRTFVDRLEDDIRTTRYAFYDPIYLPGGREKMSRYRYFYQPLTVQQVLNAMFVDASLTRQVTERDGTMIYTNGSQSVSIPSERNYLLYRHPMHEWEKAQGERPNYEALSSALSFINQHGGWIGRYYLESVDDVNFVNRENTVAYRFRQYIGTYPLFSGDGPDLNTISARVSGGNVSELYYPMRQLDLYFERIPVTVVSGTELMKWLENKGINKHQVGSIELGLYTRSIYDFIEMKPCWVVYLKDKEPLYVEADVAGFGK
ncbi:YycH family regulatory protein [Aneurinibacillus sp. UBA3580]|uniref:YycH family regulatory protein n=1 Tax=Aneurinibacillus sp. UBA3580 TaxID=1946041 RepID=UPI00257D3F9B|nr:two-component system activity regulator YycH [Aneurinibacillus sp. UBA3580]